MPLRDIVSIAISTESVKVLQAGFGIPLILSPNVAWAERTRTYTDLAGMSTDGFSTTGPEYLMASALFAQDPRPEKVVVGRLANKPTQRYTVTVKTVENSKKYQLRVRGNTAEFTADATATNDEIVAGLMAAVNALTGDTTTATTDSTGGVGAHKLLLTADAAGNWDAVESLDVNYLEVVQDHADPGAAADLGAIKLENDTWYAVLNAWNSKAMVTAIAAWVETAKKLFIAQTIDTPVISTAKSGTDDVAEALQAAAYARTALIYHPATDAFADAAWAGRGLPLDPGSETWALKTLAGVTAKSLTSTHITNLEAKGANWYETISGVNVTRTGIVVEGEWIDVIRFRDWLEARLSERIFATLAKVNKVPYTDKGIATIEAEVRAQLQEGVDVGGLSSDPAPKVTVPKVSTVASADKNARILKNVKFDAQLAGAIHAIQINGTITV